MIVLCRVDDILEEVLSKFYWNYFVPVRGQLGASTSIKGKFEEASELTSIIEKMPMYKVEMDVK